MSTTPRASQEPSRPAGIDASEDIHIGASFSEVEQNGTPGEKASRRSEQSSDHHGDDDKASFWSSSHWGPEPGFEHIDGDITGTGYNETTVDIIAIPCIGASPVDTWTRDPLTDGYFGFPQPSDLPKYATVKELPAFSLLSPTIDRVLPKASHVWIRQGIRKEVSSARVMLYRHRELTEGMNLENAADDLMNQILQMRAQLTKSRPMFFICHSIGGLVAKMALVKAVQREDLRPLVFDCHGMTFFGTPHLGSSYLSMANLRESIQHLLYLQKPLPRSITDELRLGYKPLLKLHEKFVDMASEFRVWTFYETIDSQLSGLGTSDFDEVHFSAPLTSIKSCLIGTRAERALSLESDHAHCASFGPNNIQMMHSYLADLGEAVRKAEELSATKHTPLRLPTKVKLEIIGFYEDPDGETSQDLRLYVSKHYLNEFLEKGPEDCLRERLNTVAAKPRRGTLPPSRRLTSSPSRMGGALGVFSHHMQEFGQRFLSSGRTGSASSSPDGDGERPHSPEIVVTRHMHRPSIAGASTEPMPSSSPRRSRGLAVPALSTPGFHRPSSRGSDGHIHGSETARTMSEPATTDVSPKTPLETAHAKTRDGIEDEDNAVERRSRGERVSRASALQDLTAGFSRPDPTKRKFMWIHTPFNNPHWVKNIFDKLSEVQNRNYSKLLNSDYWVSRHVQGRHRNRNASYVKSGCAFVPAEISSPRPSSPIGSGRSVSPNITPSHFYLYLPYLHYDTYVNTIRRRQVIRQRMDHGRARPVPKDIAELESLESRVIWEFIGHDPPLNARRTLDQYGYPSLRDTYARDDDQMLYKLTKERIVMPRKRDMYHMGDEPSSAVSPATRLVSAAEAFMKSDDTSHAEQTDLDLGDDIIDGNVIMVDQLWLWAVDQTTLMTFFPKRESHPTEGPLFQQADLRNSVYNELNGDLTGRCENALDLAAFITLHAVTVLLDRTSHPDLEIFRLFEEALGILTGRMTSALKAFRMQTYKDNVHDSSDSDSEDNNSSENIKKRHREEVERAERQNRENTSAVLELRDMEDELNTFNNLFSEQQSTIENMKYSHENSELQGLTGRGRGFLKEALSRLEEYKRQTHDMLSRVDSARRDYEKLQEMIQRQAQVDEVRWSRLQTELASSQNLTVMIFTTFTVIFLPLSFFTSLFGMNTQEWGGPDENNFVGLGTIGAISLPASAFIIAATLIIAFSSRVQLVFRAVFKAWRSTVSHTTHQLEKLEPTSSKLSKERKQQQKRQRERRVQRKRERGYDFWETVRAERHSAYEIPDMNRKAATRRRLAGKGTWKQIIRDGY
ncbi:hypothetical protein F5Y15DRAFT_32202 [Xylariaceae sp. FL0016]|nr:hypothetical protein F5Y15DRAFT_32202 [Xylariaceae sp. FL0016]